MGNMFEECHAPCMLDSSFMKKDRRIVAAIKD